MYRLGDMYTSGTAGTLSEIDRFVKEIGDLSMYEALITKLDWNDETTSSEITNEIINLGISDLSFLLQPINKSYWDKAANVICELGVERYIDVLPSMMEWIQDLNWPGALRIFTELKSVDDIRVIRCIEDTVAKVILLDDMEWLYFIKLLIDEIGIEKFKLTCDQKDILSTLG